MVIASGFATVTRVGKETTAVHLSKSILAVTAGFKLEWCFLTVNKKENKVPVANKRTNKPLSRQTFALENVDE